MTNIYYDIETAPDEDRVRAELELKPYPEFEHHPPKNWKDPEKIEAHRLETEKEWFEKKNSRESEAMQAAKKTPRTGRILLITAAWDDRRPLVLDQDEETVIKDFWDMAGLASGRLMNWTGHNKGTGNFDRNFLYRRSWALGIRPPYIANDLWHDVAKDFLRYADWGSYCKLEDAARELGIEVKDCDGVHGGNFYETYVEDREKALPYALQDVELVREIHRRVG